MKSARLLGRSSNAKVKVNNCSNKRVGLGDIIWVKLDSSSWWPTQVVDSMSVSQKLKPRKRSADKVLVRLYGSYNYRFVNPATHRSEFERYVRTQILKKNDGHYGAILEKTLKKELACHRSESANRSKPEPEGQVQSEVDENNTNENLSAKIIPAKYKGSENQEQQLDSAVWQPYLEVLPVLSAYSTGGKNCRRKIPATARRMKVVQDSWLKCPWRGLLTMERPFC